MFDPLAQVSSQFDKGQVIALKNGTLVGVIVAVFFNEFSSQFVYTVRVVGMSIQPQWCEGAVEASHASGAVQIGDMVIADSRDGSRDMGTVIDKTALGKLVVRMADGVYVVSMTRVWRVAPMSLFARSAACAA